MTEMLAALISASHFFRTSSLASGWPAFAKARLAFPSWPRENSTRNCFWFALVTGSSKFFSDAISLWN
jgi:hypothetical protein